MATRSTSADAAPSITTVVAESIAKLSGDVICTDTGTGTMECASVGLVDLTGVGDGDDVLEGRVHAAATRATARSRRMVGQRGSDGEEEPAFFEVT